MPTNQFERDMENVAGKRFPGRYDPRELQNKDDVGDGSPGIQKCFRNYLHEGGMEKDLDVNNHNLDNVDEAEIATANITTANITTNNVTTENVAGDLDVDGETNLDDTDIDGTLDVAGVTDFHDEVDMNSNKITALTNGAAAQDAMAFGQRNPYDDDDARASINDIFGVDGKADSDIDLDDNNLDNIETAKFTEQSSDPNAETNKLVLFAEDGIFYFMDQYGFKWQVDTVHGWDVSSSVWLQELDISGKELSIEDVFFKPDGLKMYIVGGNSDAVHEYDLSPAWDVSSGIWLQEFDIFPTEPNPTGIFFKQDGLKMYITGGSGTPVINEYDLNVAWDVSSSVWLQELGVAAKTASIADVFFKQDGLKMYTTGPNSDAVHEYDLSVAWDVSSGIWLQEFDISGEDNACEGVFFKQDGLKMYIIGTENDSIQEYDLSVAWDVSTSVWLQAFANGKDTIPNGLFFKPDGLKMYIAGSSTRDVHEYNLKPV